MTSLHTKKSISTGISIAGLLAAAVGMADIAAPHPNGPNGENGIVEKPVDQLVDGASSEKTLEAKKLVLEDLNHEELVKQLANESFVIREEATNLVWRRGKPALAALENALSSGNPELISRSTELLKFIRAGVSPDSPPHIAKLVESFDDATNDQKEDIMRELYAERAYTQMLFMLSEMKDRALALSLYEDFNFLAQRAAKDSVAKGDIEAAIEQLKMAPNNETTQRSLAYLYALTGKLNDELDRIGKLNIELLDKDWERHLNLEKTNRADIRKFAQRESIMGVIANLNLLEGDPSLMFEYYFKKAAFTAKVGLAVIKAQYDGDSDDFVEKVHAQQEQILQASIKDAPTNIQYQAIKILCLTGGANLVEPYSLKKFRYDSFLYADHKEQPKKALAILGILDEDTLKKFIKDNTILAIEEFEIDQDDKLEFAGPDTLSYQDRLLTVAEFYYKRGERDIAKSVMTPLLKELQAQENNEWYKVAESIANLGMHDLAIDIVLERGDDDKTYEQMVTYLYDDTVETDLVWNTLLKRVGVAPEKSFRDLAVVMGVYQAELKTYLQLQDELIKIATNEGNMSLKLMRTALHSVATYRQDAISSARHAKQLLDAEEVEDSIPMRKLEYLRSLADCLDWKGIVTILDEDRSFIRNSPKWYAIYSIAKRKMGDIEEADELLNYAKLISIGLDYELRDIAIEHYLAEYDDISTEIIERLLIIGSVERDSGLYKYSLSYLSRPANSYTSAQQWGKAASFYMVNAARDMVEQPSSIVSSNISYYTSDYYNTQFTRGMELYHSGEKAKGLKMLANAHHAVVGDGNLADHFYPAIRTTDLAKQYDLWVEESYQHLASSIEEFPKCSNTHNTLAWILSRAVRKVDEGIKHSETSLELTPFEASYLDTMGELHHAKGDRKSAVEWGEKAVEASKYGRLDIYGSSSSARRRSYSLSGQLERFKTESHPKGYFSKN